MLVQRAKQLAADHATKLPRFVGRGLLALNRGGHLYGGAYARYRHFLANHRAHYEPEHALLASVRAAIASVPYYRARYAGRRIASLADFEQLAFIDRDEITASCDAMIADDIRREDYDTCATGGTSGTPLTFLAPKNRYVVELATMHALWAEAGFDHHVRAVVRNHRLPDGTPYVIDPLRREVIFDGFRLGDDDLDHVHRTIVRLGIEFVHCYPSAAAELAGFLVRRGRSPGPIRAFLCGSETVFPYQRELVETQLGVRLYSWYGHSEKLVLAGYCRDRAAYHVEPTYGYFELVDESGRRIREPGVTGEIVGTSLHNPGMPLVRYRTGDFATYAGDHCDACGRDVEVLESIAGQRSGERLYRADGSYITTTALNFHDELQCAFLGLQYIQTQRGQLDVLIVKAPHFIAAHERELLTHLRGRLGDDLTVRVRYVDRLERAANGKSPHVISRVTPR